MTPELIGETKGLLGTFSMCSGGLFESGYRRRELMVIT